jgi:predicted lipid-binding transport protein (Tim44 family)
VLKTLARRLSPRARLARLSGLPRWMRPARWPRLRLRRQRVGLPPLLGLSPAEVEDFLGTARASFVGLQAAWDAQDLATLARLTTEPLLEELRDQLAARGPGPNRTEVLRLEAQLLGLDELHEAFVASVEFSGLIRETGAPNADANTGANTGADAGDPAACPFRELWLLAKVKAAGQGWRLARVQALA